jgi:hypothetical protein
MYNNKSRNAEQSNLRGGVTPKSNTRIYAQQLNVLPG